MINKKIHEIMGLCWHEVVETISEDELPECVKCNALFISDTDFNIDFCTSWEAFGILWEWWQKHDKFNDFLREASANRVGFIYWRIMVSPRSFAEATVEFFKKEVEDV